MVGFPLLLIPLAVYNIIAFLMPSVSFGDTLFKLPLVSHVLWPVTLSDILLTVGVLLLLLEIVKAARPGAKYITDHLLSLVVFGCAAAEFVMWPKFGTSTYFLLTLLSLTDFLTGISLRARRPAPVAPATIQRQAVPPSAPEVEPPTAPAQATEHLPAAPVAEPVGEPADFPEPAPPAAAAPVAREPAPEPAPEPKSSTRSAASVAESVLMNHPARRSAQPDGVPNGTPAVAGSEASSDVVSPELQPESHAPEPPQQH
nr:hypothetical protein [Bradyrhizobium sp.]